MGLGGGDGGALNQDSKIKQAGMEGRARSSVWDRLYLSSGGGATQGSQAVEGRRNQLRQEESARAETGVEESHGNCWPIGCS